MMTSRRLVTDYVKYRLKKEELYFPGPNSEEYHKDCDKLREPIRALCKEFEERYITAFENMVDQIHITDDNVKDSFTSVINELFSDGIRWGRIVGLFSFAGAICVQCVQKEMPYKVDQVVDWTTTYLDTDLKPWMDENGGWDGFLKFSKTVSLSEKDQENFWSRTLPIIGVATGAAILLGSILLKR